MWSHCLRSVPSMEGTWSYFNLLNVSSAIFSGIYKLKFAAASISFNLRFNKLKFVKNSIVFAFMGLLFNELPLIISNYYRDIFWSLILWYVVINYYWVMVQITVNITVPKNRKHRKSSNYDHSYLILRPFENFTPQRRWQILWVFW